MSSAHQPMELSGDETPRRPVNMRKLENLRREIDRLNGELRSLRKEATQRREKVRAYEGEVRKELEASGKSRVRLADGRVFALQFVERHKRKRAADKRNDQLNVLRAAGVKDPAATLKELEREMRGVATQEKKVKIEATAAATNRS